MLTKDDFVIRGFNCIHLTSLDIGDRVCRVSQWGMASLAVSVHSTLLYVQAKAVTISTSKTITICPLYLSSNDNLNSYLLTRLIDQLPTSFVVCGDFNGHSMTWGCDKNHSRGDKIDYFIADYYVCVA